jgi:ApbE superfamily uncharacterized protein (UPF0280 family)
MSSSGKKYSDYSEVVGRRGVAIRLGPMRMTIIAERRGTPLINEAKRGAHIAVKLLEIAARYKNLLAKNVLQIQHVNSLPKVVKECISACRLVQDRTLTPMAAIAGSIADIVADVMVEAGATKVVVDNGGEIAIRLEEGEYVRVGIVPTTAGICTHVIEVTADSGIGGIATSGFGGRGFTKGIASAATTLAKRASLADAAATVVGNATFSKGVKAICGPARLLDPASDIREHQVVLKVSEIPRSSAIGAIKNGLKAAKKLIEAGVLKGSIIVVNEYSGMIPEDLPIRPVTKYLLGVPAQG